MAQYSPWLVNQDHMIFFVTAHSQLHHDVLILRCRFRANLVTYMAFCALFMVIIILGTKNAAAVGPGALYSMSNSIRDVVIDEYGSFTSNVRRSYLRCSPRRSFRAPTQENALSDWWGYLFDEEDETKGWFGNIFPKSWYNGENYTNDEAAMIMNYNKLVGKQAARKRVPVTP